MILAGALTMTNIADRNIADRSTNVNTNDTDTDTGGGPRRLSKMKKRRGSGTRRGDGALGLPCRLGPLSR